MCKQNLNTNYSFFKDFLTEVFAEVFDNVEIINSDTTDNKKDKEEIIERSVYKDGECISHEKTVYKNGKKVSSEGEDSPQKEIPSSTTECNNDKVKELQDRIEFLTKEIDILRAKSARLKEINKSLESKLEETNNDIEMMLNKFKNNLRK